MNITRISARTRAAIFVLACSLGIALAATLTSAEVTPAQANKANAIFARDNITAWCIVPYDGKERNPEQRADMLQRIGIKHFAYDWRDKHLPSFDQELDELKKRNIQLNGVWFPDSLTKEARFMLDCLARHGVKTQLWVMTTGYASLGDKAPEAAVARLRPVAEEAGKIGCTLGLYNHGGWAAQPDNMVDVVTRLKAAGLKNVGIVYNFSHAYGDLDQFEERFHKMLPHLLAVNLNGMTKQPGRGDVITPVGRGELDVKLIKIVRDSGYAGPIGLINESEEDAEGRLLDNLEGLDWILPQLDGLPAPVPRPQPRVWREPNEKQKGAGAAAGAVGVAGVWDVARGRPAGDEQGRVPQAADHG